MQCTAPQPAPTRFGQTEDRCELLVDSGVHEHEPQRLRRGAAYSLEVALEREVVCQVQVANARRLAATAQVFEQQRVVQPPLVMR